MSVDVSRQIAEMHVVAILKCAVPFSSSTPIFAVRLFSFCWKKDSKSNFLNKFSSHTD